MAGSNKKRIAPTPGVAKAISVTTNRSKPALQLYDALKYFKSDITWSFICAGLVTVLMVICFYLFV
jgi:hypothetical protein